MARIKTHKAHRDKINERENEGDEQYIFFLKTFKNGKTNGNFGE